MTATGETEAWDWSGTHRRQQQFRTRVELGAPVAVRDQLLASPPIGCVLPANMPWDRVPQRWAPFALATYRPPHGPISDSSCHCLRP